MKSITTITLGFCLLAIPSLGFAQEMVIPSRERFFDEDYIKFTELWKSLLSDLDSDSDGYGLLGQRCCGLLQIGYFGRLKEGRDVQPMLNLLERARKAVLRDPAHAEFLRGAILQRPQRGSGLPDNYFDKEYSLSEPIINSSNAFGILRRLPTPQTVEVLCDLLYEGNGAKDGYPLEMLQKGDLDPASIRVQAVVTLGSLGIKNPPVAPTADLRTRLVRWGEWFKEMREGGKTFSFEGDPAVYTIKVPGQGVKDPATR